MKSKDFNDQPMEGKSVRSRLWALVLQELPFPLRWLGMEIVVTVHWLDRCAGQAIFGLRHSPLWCFVTLVGTFAVFLTLLLFGSLIHETSGHRLVPRVMQSAANLGRRDLEKIHDWSVQDKWRIAHIFVPHRPTPKHQDIQLDSRLTPAVKISSRRGSRTSASTKSTNPQLQADIDVRLDLSRPKRAQRGDRLAAATVYDLGSNRDSLPNPRLRRRDPQLLVQATWDMGSDCDQSAYVSRPTRRSIPVPPPEPEPERMHVAAPHVRPDLAFVVEMIRHSTVSGMFPPGSHLVHLSDRSVFPGSDFPDDGRYSSELVSHDDRRWQRFDPIQTHSAARIIPYDGVGVHDSSNFEREKIDQHDPNLDAVAEVALRIELSTPELVRGGAPNLSKLLVSNEGQTTIPRIEVREDLSRLHTVVAAEPDATTETDVDSETGLRERQLHREVLGLSPSREQEFSLRWLAEGDHRQFYRARVTTHTEVSAFSNVIRPVSEQQIEPEPPETLPVTHPSIACDVQHLDRVRTGENFELEITVRNTGDTTLHRVQVKIDIPESLSHRDGRVVSFDAGDLPVKGTNQTVVKMSTLRAGEAANILTVSAEEPIAATGRAVVLIVDRSQPRKLTPVVSSGTCSCQKTTTSSPFNSSYSYPQ